MRFRRSIRWLWLIAAMLIALTTGCASGASYRQAPASPGSARFDDEAGFKNLEREEVAYGAATAGDVDADVADVAEAEPMAEPAPDGAGDYMPPPPAPPAEERIAQAGPMPVKKTPAADPSSTGAGAPITTPPPVTTDVPQPTTEPAQPAQDAKLAGPLLIYNATLYLAVYEASKSIDAVQKLATDLGGYLVRRSDRTITVRVPAAKFRAALAGVGKLGDVLHREESVQDVTDEFFDLQVRLRNAHAMRDRLAKLLEQATNVEEALMVEKELGRVTEEIERFEGRLKLLRELIAFSTITVEFKPRPTERVSNVRLPFYWLNQLGLSQLLSL